MGFGELFEEGLRRVKLEGQGRFADGDGGGFLTHLLALEVALEGVEEEAIMGDAVPVEDLLFLLGANTVVLVEEVQKSALGLLEGGVGAGFEVTQVREDTFLELLGILDGPTKSLEAEGQTANDVGAGDMKEIVPVCHGS